MNLPLKTHLTRLPSPNSYLRGVNPPQLRQLPTEVIVFSRGARHADSKRTEPITHHRYILVLALAGAGKALIGERRINLSAGQAVLILPHQVHYFDLPRKTFSWFIVGFEHEQHDILAQLGNRCLSLPHQTIQIFDEMLNGYSNQGKAAQEINTKVTYQLGYFLAQLLEVNHDRPIEYSHSKTKQEKLIEAIHDHIHTHPKGKLSVADIAQSFGYSVSHLRRLYREEMGFSLGAYMKHARIMRAKIQLVESDLSIQAIAEACSFGSVYAFSNAFKKILGISPSQYRKAERK